MPSTREHRAGPDSDAAIPQVPTEHHADGRRSSMIAGALCAALSVGASWLFLPHQSLWVDEVDQLGGLGLSPLEVTRWLAGRSQPDLIMPFDGMPPVSYWVGWVWSKIFGLGEVQLRWFGVTCVAVATWLMYQTARRAWGQASGVAAGVLFALSPNVIMQAVEIRAYPLLLLIAVATLYCFMRLLADPVTDRPGWLVSMAACGAIAIYTHFFGLVLIGSCLLAALILVTSRGGRKGPILLVIVVGAVSSLGLIPFIRNSIRTFSASAAPHGAPTMLEKVGGLAKMIFHCFASPITVVNPIAFGAACIGAALGGLACLAAKRRSATASSGFLLALLAGILVVGGVHLGQSVFDAARHSYSNWMIPAGMLLLSSGLAARAAGFRKLALAGVVLMTLANLYGARELAIHGDYFAHGPYRRIEAILRSVDTDKVAVIHDGGSGYGDALIPLLYAHGSALPQYISDDLNSGGVIIVDSKHRQVQSKAVDLTSEYLMVIHSVRYGTPELAEQLRGGIRPIAEGPTARRLRDSKVWIPVRDATFPGYVGARVTLFRRAAAGVEDREREEAEGR